jgi:hypothetical protein
MRFFIQFIVLLAVFFGPSGRQATRNVFRVSGIVQYPDGKPSAGAEVTGVTACEQEPFHLVQEAKTAADGSFNLQFVNSECNRIRLSASKIDELWLKTGTDVFYTKENGTAPIIEAPATGSPAEAVIRLGERGGLVQFRVWDKATEGFIWATVYLERLPVSGARFGSMSFATGRDGSADNLFLPEGEYQFSIRQYACNNAVYFAARSGHETFRVEVGQRVAREMSLDVRQIKTLPSYDNPHGKTCSLK